MASARTTVSDVLDPFRLLHSGDPPKTPGYVEENAKYNAQLGQQTGDLANTGWGWATVTDANGQPRQQFQQMGPSAPDLLRGQQQFAQQALGANNNPGLGQFRVASQMAQSGATGNALLADARGATQSAWAQNAQTAPYLGGQGQAIQGAQRDLGIVRNSAEGAGPSAAENLARAQLGANIRSQSAMAAQARGGNVAAGLRSAALAGQNMQLQSQSTIAAQRAQEQLNAQQLLTQGNANVMAGSNALTGAAQANANQFGNVAGQATAQGAINAQLSGQGLAGMGQASAQYGQQQQGLVDADAAARKAYTDYLMQQYSLANGIPVQAGAVQNRGDMAAYQAQQQQAGANSSLVGGIIGAII